MWGRHLHSARSWAGRSQWAQIFCPPWPNDWLQPGAQPYSHCLGGPGGEPGWQQSCQGDRGWPTDSSLYTAASYLSGHRSCDHVSPQPPLSFVYNWFTGPSRLSSSLHQKPGGSACWSSLQSCSPSMVLLPLLFTTWSLIPAQAQTGKYME